MRPTEPAISILFVKGHSPWQEQKRLGAKGRCGVKQNAGQRRPPRQRCLGGSERVATCNSFFLPRGCSPGFVPRRAAAGLPVIGIGIYWSSKPQRGWRAASDLDVETRTEILDANGTTPIGPIGPRSHRITNWLRYWYWLRKISGQRGGSRTSAQSDCQC